MNKKRVSFHESVKKEDGDSIKRYKNGDTFTLNQINRAINMVDKFAKLDELLDKVKDNKLDLCYISKSVLIDLKDYCSIDYDIRKLIIQELISRDN
jgi:hypothetical protein